MLHICIAQFELEEKEVKILQRQIRTLHVEQIRINNLVLKHTNYQTKLEESNLTLESGFRGKLRQAQIESIQLEKSREDLDRDKERALEILVDVE